MGTRLEDSNVNSHLFPALISGCMTYWDIRPRIYLTPLCFRASMEQIPNAWWPPSRAVSGIVQLRKLATH